MNKNQLKNLKELKSLSAIVPKKFNIEFKNLINLYEVGTFTNFLTAKNLILKLSSRGLGPEKAVKTINGLLSDAVSKQADSILSMEGYNPSESKQKKIAKKEY